MRFLPGCNYGSPWTNDFTPFAISWVLKESLAG
jgi:hypothetical protein